MTFGPNDVGGIFANPFDLFGLKDVTSDGYIAVMFQMTFAAITAALISGAIADRVKLSSWVVFLPFWVTLSYFPIGHMVWGGGFISEHFGAQDYAGGTVVHINAGVAGLVLAAGDRQARRLHEGADEAAQPDAHHDRRRPPVVRLVRLQRRLDRLHGRRPTKRTSRSSTRRPA